MSGFQVTIKTGPSQKIGGGPLPAGALIFNADTKNTVWVSSQQSVSPFNGMRIDPLGSVQWIANVQGWAVVDTGVLTPIQLIISDDVNNINTPVSVANAILANGVPSVQLYNQVFNGFVAAGGNAALDVHAFAALEVQVSNSDNATNCLMKYQFIDSASGIIVDSGLLSADTQVANPSWPNWTLPVVADRFKLFGAGVNSKALVIGTNTHLPKRLGGDFFPVRRFTTTFAANAPNGTRQQLTDLDPGGSVAPLVINLSNYNGQCLFDFFGTGTSLTAMNFEAQWVDASNVQQNAIYFQNPSTTHQYRMSGHPYAFTSWYARLAVVGPANTMTINLNIFPATAPL